jgi:hypothetical protein
MINFFIELDSYFSENLIINVIAKFTLFYKRNDGTIRKLNDKMR